MSLICVNCAIPGVRQRLGLAPDAVNPQPLPPKPEIPGKPIKVEFVPYSVKDDKITPSHYAASYEVEFAGKEQINVAEHNVNCVHCGSPTLREQP